MSITHTVPLISGETKEVTSTVISSIPQLNECLHKLMLSVKKENVTKLVGLDVMKTFRTISDSQVHVCEKVAILSLCHGTTCFIIQLHLMTSPPNSLSEFLQQPWLRFVGVGIAHSLEALERCYGIKCRNAVDWRDIVTGARSRDYRFNFNGLFDINKSAKCGDASCSDWGVEILSHNQIVAATWTCFQCFYGVNCVLYGPYSY